MVSLWRSPSAHAYVNLFEPFHFFTAGDQLVVPIGVTHISLRLQEYNQGSGRKENKRTKRLGLTQVKKESYVTLCMCRLTLVWTQAKLPQSYWNADSIFFHWSGPSLVPTRLSAPVSSVDCLCPSSLANCQLLSPFLSHSLTGAPSPLLVTSRMRVQNPLSGFAPKQTKESSAWRTTYIVLHLSIT